ncbi:MAG: thioredoxin family protein [Hyphomonadaceae bacterium]
MAAPWRSLIALLALIVAGAAAAALLMRADDAHDNRRTFDMATFRAAQAAGEPILVETWASWCGTCRAQSNALDRLAADGEMAGVAVFRLDVDRNPADMRALGADAQSTLLAYCGETLTARSVGETRPRRIANMVKTLAACTAN